DGERTQGWHGAQLSRNGRSFRQRVTTPMMGKPFLVVSDVHLGAVPASTEASFRRFLDYARENASGLLINGDLFEFGVAYRSVIPSKHYRVLAKLADLVDAGVPVYFTGGNHDHC